MRAATAHRPRTHTPPFRSGLPIRSEHLIAGAVAVGCVALALPGGGYGLEFRAGGTILVWWVVIVGLVVGLWPRAAIPRSALVAGSALAGLCAVTALSMAWASDDGRAFEEVVRVAGYLGLFALVVVASPGRTARSWLSGLAIGLGVVAALALGSRFHPAFFPDPDLAAFLPEASTRLSYPLNYWNGLGAAMGLAVVLLVWLSSAARTRVGRAAAAGAVPMPSLALFLTSSRGGVAAMVVGLTALVALGSPRVRILTGAMLGGAGAGVLIALANAREAFVDGKLTSPDATAQGHEMLVATLVVAAVVGVSRLVADRKLHVLRIPRPAAIVATIAALVVVAGAAVAADPGRRLDELNDPPAGPVGPTRGLVTRHITSAEGTGRYQFWEAAWKAFEHDPLKGVGAGGYQAWWAEHASFTYYIRDAHSLFLESAAELGVAGAALIVAFLLSAARAGWRRRSIDDSGVVQGALAGLACGVASAAIDWTWELPAAFGPVVVIAAVLAGPALVAWGRGAGGYGWGVATLLVGWAAVVTAGIALVTEVKLDDSRSSARHGDLAAAANDARAASKVEPWAAAPYLQLALVEERRGNIDSARRASDQALRRAPDDWRGWLVAARLRTKAGEIQGARDALRRARTLNPRSPILADRPP